MVCNLHFPTGNTYFRIFQNLEQKGISGEKTLPDSWLDEKLSLLLPRPGREPMTSRTPRLHNKQGVALPTHSAIGRRSLIVDIQSCTYTVLYYSIILETIWRPKYSHQLMSDYSLTCCWLDHLVSAKHCSGITSLTLTTLILEVFSYYFNHVWETYM